MGSALPFDERYDDERYLARCDQCDTNFLLYKDKVPTCKPCLQNPTLKKERSRISTTNGFLFDN